MTSCEVGYALMYVTILRLQLVRQTVVGQITAKFKLVILPLPGFSLSNTSYIWIYKV
jgi:hypothetical protein